MVGGKHLLDRRLLIIMALCAFLVATCSPSRSEGGQDGPEVIGPDPVIIIPKATEDGLQPTTLAELIRSGRVPAAFPTLPDWQGRDYCGLNCVYALLRLTGNRTSYGQLRDAVGDIPKGGLSLKAMAELAERFGVPCQIIKGNVSRLPELQPPVIVHIGEPEQPGHFVCYYRKSGQDVLLLDGTSGGVVVAGDGGGQSLEQIARQASGYLLIPATTNSPAMAMSVSFFRVLSYLTWGAALACWIALGIKRYRGRSSVRIETAT